MKNRNVLVFVLSHIGDFVWATSAISLIKNYDNNINVTLITCNNMSQLIDTEKLGINKLLLINKKIFNCRSKISLIIYELLWLIKNFFKFFKYDTLILLEKAKFITLAAKYIYRIKIIAGADILSYGYNNKNPDSKYYTHIVNMPADADRTHMMMRYQLIIRSIFTPPTYNMAVPVLIKNKTISPKIKNILSCSKKYKIAICTNGAADIQTWPVKYFTELLNKINIFVNATFFIVGSGNKQNNTAEYIKKEINEADIRNLCYQTSLLEICQLLQNIDLVITVDTGIAHLAALYKIPTIDIVGHVLPQKALPVNHNAVCLYSDRICSPCTDKIFKEKFICTDINCMSDITPDMVFEKVRSFLN